MQFLKVRVAFLICSQRRQKRSKSKNMYLKQQSRAYSLFGQVYLSFLEKKPLDNGNYTAKLVDNRKIFEITEH